MNSYQRGVSAELVRLMKPISHSSMLSSLVLCSLQMILLPSVLILNYQCLLDRYWWLTDTCLGVFSDCCEYSQHVFQTVRINLIMQWVFTYKSIYNYYEPIFASRYVPAFASLRAVLPRLSFFRVIPNLPSNPSLALVSQQDSLPSPRKISTCLTQWLHRQNQPFVSLWINLRNRFNCVLP